MTLSPHDYDKEVFVNPEDYPRAHYVLTVSGTALRAIS